MNKKSDLSIDILDLELEMLSKNLLESLSASQVYDLQQISRGISVIENSDLNYLLRTGLVHKLEEEKYKITSLILDKYMHTTKPQS